MTLHRHWTTAPRFRRYLPLALICLALSCDKEDTIVVQNIHEALTNQPPRIVAYGPDMPAGGFQQLSYSRIGVKLWVLVADPNGLEDISLVTMDMDSLRLVRMIVHPDTSASSCIEYGYQSGDTLPSNAILPLPAGFPGVKFLPLTRVQGGLYQTEGLGGEFGFPDLIEASPVLEDFTGFCYAPGTYQIYGPFRVVPPAVPSPRDAGIHYATVDYYGIKMAVYDKVGASATVTYPTLRVIFKVYPEPTPFPLIPTVAMARHLR